ncbi:MAG: sugar phosphate isomerase/epimerase family protein [Christensenellales bacterium]|jgi:sugar phosphate isomerase/epimerase
MGNFILSAFADEIGDDLSLQIRVLKENQIDFVEFRSAYGRNVTSFSLEETAAIGKAFRSDGIRVSAIGSPLGKISITDDFSAHMKMFRHTLEIAQEMEAPYIRLFSFYPPEGESITNYRNLVMDCLATFVKEASGTGVTLLHENEKDVYGDIPSRCLDIMQTINSPILRATYDFSNFVQCGVDNDEAFALLKPYVEYIHLKDSLYTGEKAERDLGRQVVGNAHRPVGMGDGKVRKILSSLWKDGFEGFASIEPHLGEEYGAEGIQRFTVAARAAQALLNEISK